MTVLEQKKSPIQLKPSKKPVKSDAIDPPTPVNTARSLLFHFFSFGKNHFGPVFVIVTEGEWHDTPFFRRHSPPPLLGHVNATQRERERERERENER